MIESMTELKQNIENFQYSVDVLREYSDLFSNNDDLLDRIFILGKISAALEEVKIQYDCLNDIVFDDGVEKKKSNNYGNSDTITFPGAESFLSSFSSGIFDTGSDTTLKISSELLKNQKNNFENS